VTLRWNLAPGDCRLDSAQRQINLEAGDILASIAIENPLEMQMTITEGVATRSHTGGWMSEYYAERKPAPVLEVTGIVALPTKLVTKITLQ
jgi:hypothetical protein